MQPTVKKLGKFGGLDVKIMIFGKEKNLCWGNLIIAVDNGMGNVRIPSGNHRGILDEITREIADRDLKKAFAK
jgi:hypothetical protein